MPSWFKLVGITFVSHVVAHVINKLLINITKYSASAEVFNMKNPLSKRQIELNDTIINLTDVASVSGKITGHYYKYNYVLTITYKDATKRELVYQDEEAFNKDCILICERALSK